MRYPISILYYIPLLSVGGTERRLVDLACGLDRRMFSPQVWCSGPWGPIGDMLVPAGIPVLMKPLDCQNLDATVRYLRTLDITIFHSFSYRLDAGDVIAAALADVPVIITSRGNMRHWDTRGVRYEWETIRNSATDVVVACCHAVGYLARQVEGIPADRMKVIYTGVSAESYPADRQQLRATLGMSESSVVLGNVGNFRPVKGHDTLIAAFGQVVRRVPHARLVLCGMNAGCEAQVIHTIDQLQLRDYVVIRHNTVDVTPLYAAMDLYVHSSVSEGLPRAVLEAMRHGLPIVATAVGGTSEAVVHGIHGILVPPNSPNVLARVLLDLISNRDLRRRVGDAARKRLQRRFHLDKMIAQHQSLYRRAISTAYQDRGDEHVTDTDCLL